MVVIKDGPSVVFLGYNKNRGYTFIIKDKPGEKPTLISYTRLKFLSCGGESVYFCEDNGMVTKNWNPITISSLKSIINKRKQDVIASYKQSWLEYKSYAEN